MSLTSNVVEEYTLLVCITPRELAAKETLTLTPAMMISRLPPPTLPGTRGRAAQVKGGATIIHTLGSSVPYPETTTPGEALLFRKDLEHEAEVLEAGEKHLLSLNLWAMRKRSSGQVLHVFFPVPVETSSPSARTNSPEVSTERTGKKRIARKSVAGEAALLHAADAETSYAISVDDITSGKLHAHVERRNRQAEEEGRAKDAVVRYDCDVCSHAAFGTVFRIITRMHVSAEELHAHRAVIDFFFPVRCPPAARPLTRRATSWHAPPCE